MAQLRRNVEINLAAIPVSGFGGMCMVVASVVCAAALPATRWFMLAGIVVGIAFGVTMILIRRRGEGTRPGDDGQPRMAGHPLSVGRFRGVSSARESNRSKLVPAAMPAA